MNFLIIEDSPTQRKIISHSLKILGDNNIIEAENGLDGYHKLKENKIDCILSDWNMPILNGLELALLVRGQEQYNEIPIIMITTKGSSEDIILALKYNINSFIIKPFTPTTLEKKINAVMNLN